MLHIVASAQKRVSNCQWRRDGIVFSPAIISCFSVFFFVQFVQRFIWHADRITVHTLTGNYDDYRVMNTLWELPRAAQLEQCSATG